MGPFLFLYTAFVGFFAFAALYHLILWWSSRREFVLVVFGTDCAIRAAFSATLVGIATAVTPEEAQSTLRARLGLGLLMTATWVWNLSLISGVRARWFVWTASGLLLFLCLLHTFVVSLGAQVLAVDRVTLPWGETIADPRMGVPGWWFAPVYALALAIEVFGLICGSRLLRRDRLAGALLLAAVCGLTLLHVLQILRGFGIVSVPLVGVVPHVFWVCAVALLIARGNDQVRGELEASEERFRTWGNRRPTAFS